MTEKEKKPKEEKKKAEPYLIACHCQKCGNQFRKYSNEKRVCPICGSTDVTYKKYDKDPKKEKEE